MIPLRRPGPWGDVFDAGQGLIGLAFAEGNNIKIEIVTKTGEVRGQSTFQFNKPPLFITAAMSMSGQIAACAQAGDLPNGEKGGEFLIAGVESPAKSYPTYGTHVCDIVPFNGGFRYVFQASYNQFYDSQNKTLNTIPPAIWGTSQGIIQLIPNGQPQWSDLLRESVSGMFYPFELPNLFIGEGRTDPAHIHGLDSGEHKNIYVGIAERPRGVIVGNTVAVATRDGQGTLFLLYEKPLPNYSLDPIPIPPDPEPEPEMQLPDNVKTIIGQMAAKYPLPIGEDAIREWTIKVDEQVAYSVPNQGWGTKRADPGRPVSKDTISQKVSGKLYAWDLVSGAGTSNPTLVYNSATAMDITGQVFIGPGDDLDDGAIFTPTDFLNGQIPGPDPNPNPDPIDPTPIAPPQNIIQDSLNNLRNFCQTYTAPANALPEYVGQKPYQNDEIHDNGLFIADGLIYFMMSDTGNWAKILMDPGDKRPWNEKRTDADNALFTYMRRRVGDNS